LDQSWSRAEAHAAARFCDFRTGHSAGRWAQAVAIDLLRGPLRALVPVSRPHPDPPRHRGHLFNTVITQVPLPELNLTLAGAG